MVLPASLVNSTFSSTGLSSNGTIVCLSAASSAIGSMILVDVVPWDKVDVSKMDTNKGAIYSLDWTYSELIALNSSGNIVVLNSIQGLSFTLVHLWIAIMVNGLACDNSKTDWE